ncbi:PLD nuclease N-terminal domain-containing protein [Streptomyces sp. NPDC090127]|uniref:PLD nuclease N-terminal domain-containing protein n=1 Tax=Streptomyces sp. NPDC090127 TaxID=3365953 RepID=UPI0037F40F63
MLRALMFILPLALTIYACIDCVTTPDEETKHLPKLAWVVLILLFPIAAALVWFFAGKQRRGAFGTGGAGGTGGVFGAGGRGRASNRWVAPDDNPEFLRSLREEDEKDEKGDEPSNEQDGDKDGDKGKDK